MERQSMPAEMMARFYQDPLLEEALHAAGLKNLFYFDTSLF